MEKSMNVDYLGVPPFQETPISIYIYKYTWSLHYPSFLGSFAKHLFFEYV